MSCITTAVAAHAVRAHKRRLYTAVAVISVVAIMVSQPVTALTTDESTQINVSICANGQASSSIDIQQPVSDSVVATMPLRLSGVVSGATQISVYVNDSYNNTIPLASDATSFEADLQLPQGTHTIKLVANDVCQYADPTDTVVVTYQVAATPSSGATQTDTETVAQQADQNQEITIGPTPADEASTAAAPVPPGIRSIPIFNRMFSGLELVAVALDFDTTAQSSGGVLGATTRVVALCVGVASVGFAWPTLLLLGRINRRVFTRFRKPLPKKKLAVKKPHPKKKTLLWTTRIGGIVLIICALFI